MFSQTMSATEAMPWVAIGVVSNMVWMALICAYRRKDLARKAYCATRVKTHKAILFGHVWLFCCIGNEKFDLYVHMLFECTHGLEHHIAGALHG